MVISKLSEIMQAFGQEHVLVLAAPKAEHNDHEDIVGSYALREKPRVLPFEIWKRFCARFNLKAIQTTEYPFRWLFRSKSGVSVFTQYDPRVDGRLGNIRIVVDEDETKTDNNGPFGRVRSSLALISDIPNVRTRRTKDQILEDRAGLLRAIHQHDTRIAERNARDLRYQNIREGLSRNKGRTFKGFDDLGKAL